MADADEATVRARVILEQEKRYMRVLSVGDNEEGLPPDELAERKRAPESYLIL